MIYAFEIFIKSTLETDGKRLIRCVLLLQGMRGFMEGPLSLPNTMIFSRWPDFQFLYVALDVILSSMWGDTDG